MPGEKYIYSFHKGFNMNRVICVYSSSSEIVDKLYFDVAKELGNVDC